MRIHLVLSGPIALLSAAAAAAQPTAPPPDAAQSGPSYVDLADRAIAAPIAAIVRVTAAARVKPPQAADVRAGFVRFYVEGQVETLIRGAQGLPTQVRWLVDLPLGPANRPPKLKQQRLILLAATVPERPGELRLIARDAQLPWNGATEARLRAILIAAGDPAAPPVVTGIGSAFHVPGSLPGESETQIFLTTADGRPVSLAVLRRPGEEPRWAVALGEMVDEAAAPPPRDTLLWYRLACALPAALPDPSVAALEPAAAAAAREDYRLVIAGLGPCGRTG